MTNKPDHTITETNFETTYLRAREKEQRIYADPEVSALPQISRDHIHYSEWQLRKQSSQRLVNYLGKKKKPLQILEIGCGNGWLSAKMAAIPKVTVTGIDINTPELNQARSVFKGLPNLHFTAGDIRKGIFAEMKFDIIVFAASVHYFPSLTGILNDAKKLLAMDGEIHILDTTFYTDAEIIPAQQRTMDYYEKLGFPELASSYYHHSIQELNTFKTQIHYNPRSFLYKFLKRNPFYWVSISYV